jgi:hypothetical protein
MSTFLGVIGFLVISGIVVVFMINLFKFAYRVFSKMFNNERS